MRDWIITALHPAAYWIDLSRNSIDGQLPVDAALQVFAGTGAHARGREGVAQGEGRRSQNACDVKVRGGSGGGGHGGHGEDPSGIDLSQGNEASPELKTQFLL